MRHYLMLLVWCFCVVTVMAGSNVEACSCCDRSGQSVRTPTRCSDYGYTEAPCFPLRGLPIQFCYINSVICNSSCYHSAPANLAICLGECHSLFLACLADSRTVCELQQEACVRVNTTEQCRLPFLTCLGIAQLPIRVPTPPTRGGLGRRQPVDCYFSYECPSHIYCTFTFPFPPFTGEGCFE